MKLGEQIVLKSKKAFEQIKFVEYEIADGGIYNLRRMERMREQDEHISTIMVQISRYVLIMNYMLWI